MYIPLSMLPISIIDAAMKVFTADKMETLILKLPYYTLVGIISCLLGILLLYKMPTWISVLLGVANQGVGAGGALGMLKTGGTGLGAAAMGYGKGIVSSMSGKSASGKIGMGIANALTGGLAGGAMGMAKGIGELVKNGFKAKANHFSGKGQRGAMEDTIRDNVKESALKSK